MSSWNPQDPNSQQDPYRQPPGQPQYGQPQYGQPQYGQQPPPQYGQPQYGQPQYGQQPPPQYGQPQYPPAAPGGYPGAPMPPVGSAYGYGQTGGRFPNRAGMGARFGGLIIDAIIVAIPVVIIGVLVGAFKTTTTCNADLVCTKSLQQSHIFLLDGVGLVVSILYVGFLVGMRTQSIGHQVCGIKIVDVASGGPIGFGRALLRQLVLGVTGAICTLGYWSPFFDPDRRGWHDKASNSVALSAK